MLMIFLIGLVGLLSMGFMVKFALDSTPVLMDFGKFKQTFLKEYENRGVEEIAVRALPEHRGYNLRATFGKLPGSDPAALVEELALYFAREFTGKNRQVVKVSLIEAAGWGCEGEKTISEKEFFTADLKQKLFIQKAMDKLAAAPAPGGRWSIASLRAATPDALRLEISLSAAQESEEVELNRLVEEVKGWAWEALKDVAVRRVHLVVRSSPGSEKILKEVKLDRALPSSSRDKPAVPAGAAGSSGGRGTRPPCTGRLRAGSTG